MEIKNIIIWGSNGMYNFPDCRYVSFTDGKHMDDNVIEWIRTVLPLVRFIFLNFVLLLNNIVIDSRATYTYYSNIKRCSIVLDADCEFQLLFKFETS